jgi:glycosyltransferase involved in cell wall biosynthesis
MRIALMIETDGKAGAEVMMLDLGRALRERGHEVHYVGPRDGAGWGRDAWAAEGFPCHLFSHAPPFDARCARWLAGLVREQGIQLLHAHEFLLIIYGAIASLLNGVPMVATIHGNPDMTAARRRRVALRLALSRASSVVAVSGATRQHVRETLGAMPQLVEIANGVRFAPGRRAALRDELGVRDDELLFLGVGTLTERKGFIHLLRALGTLPADLPWRAAIAGPPADAHDALRAFIAEHGWERRAHLLGPRADVPDLQAGADVFVMPSLWEGLPLALLEAMFAARPIVATRTQGIPEAIDHDREGLLVEPGDSDALAAALLQLARDGALRSRLGAAARARAVAQFSHERMVDQYEVLYRSALEARRRVRAAD